MPKPMGWQTPGTLLVISMVHVAPCPPCCPCKCLCGLPINGSFVRDALLLLLLLLMSLGCWTGSSANWSHEGGSEWWERVGCGNCSTLSSCSTSRGNSTASTSTSSSTNGNGVYCVLALLLACSLAAALSSWGVSSKALTIKSVVAQQSRNCNEAMLV